MARETHGACPRWLASGAVCGHRVIGTRGACCPIDHTPTCPAHCQAICTAFVPDTAPCTLHFNDSRAMHPPFCSLSSALPTPPLAAGFDGQPGDFEEGLRLWMRWWNGAPIACHPCARVVLMRQQAIPAHLAFTRRFLCGAWRGKPSRPASEAIYHFKSCATTDRCASGPLPPLPLGPISFAGVLKSSNARPLAMDKACSLILT